MQLWGSGGGGGRGDSSGGGGGYTQGWLKVAGGNKLYVVVGAPGRNTANSATVGYGGGGRVSNGYTVGEGGGRSAIRGDATDKTSDKGKEYATAGGGGGGGEGTGDGYGGGGGGSSGLTSVDPERGHGGRGGTQTGKGDCGTDEGNRYAGKHGSGKPLNGGGGGGWYGGGAACGGNDKCGGGGSGYYGGLVDDSQRFMKTGKMGTANTGGACAETSTNLCGKGGKPGSAGQSVRCS